MSQGLWGKLSSTAQAVQRNVVNRLEEWDAETNTGLQVRTYCIIVVAF